MMNVVRAAELPILVSQLTGSTGVSREARVIESATRAAISHTRLLPILEAVNELFEIFIETQDKDWDGEGSVPVSLATLEQAKRLLESLPPKYPAPEISASTAGEIIFDWFPGRKQVFSLTIGADGKLFAAEAGPRSRRSQVHLSASEMPPDILQNLGGLFGRQAGNS